MLGFLNVYKPSGITSAQVVSQLKKKFQIPKIGHMGTLDPLASGVLPIAIGKATKLFDLFLQKEKTYIAQFEFGYLTNTLDSEGEIIDKSAIIPTKEEIERVLSNFAGEIEQIPPQFSAKNVGGKRAYTLAREGVTVELPAKKVFISNIKLIRQLSITKFEFLITCSSGTYIRSLARDIGGNLQTYATMTALNRTMCGYFQIEDSTKVEDLENLNNHLLSPIMVFHKYGQMSLNEQQMIDLKNGKSIPYQGCNGLYWLVYQNKVFALGALQSNRMKTNVYLWEEE